MLVTQDAHRLLPIKTTEDIPNTDLTKTKEIEMRLREDTTSAL